MHFNFFLSEKYFLSIITFFKFRLIKVEEELRREQSEMQNLLRIKQELIEIQNKRIDHLSRNSISNKMNISVDQINSLNHLNYKSKKLNHKSENAPLVSSLNSNLNNNYSKISHVDKNGHLPAQIAASPSSSSSSMTQFCNYLALNIINPQFEENAANLRKSNNQLNSQVKRKPINSLATSSSSNVSSLATSNHNNYESNINSYLRTSEL